MKQMTLRLAALLCGLFLVAACTTSGSDALSSAASAEPQIDPDSQLRTNQVETRTHTDASGQEFRIDLRWDPLLRGYGTEITRTGPPLSSDTADDALVQNTLRDFFAANICSEGYFPGILESPYGPLEKRPGAWGAKIKCTTKRQANV